MKNNEGNYSKWIVARILIPLLVIAALLATQTLDNYPYIKIACFLVFLLWPLAHIGILIRMYRQKKR